MSKREENATKSYDVWIKSALLKHPDSNYDYSKVKYINRYASVIIICKKHGH